MRIQRSTMSVDEPLGQGSYSPTQTAQSSAGIVKRCASWRRSRRIWRREQCSREASSRRIETARAHSKILPVQERMDSCRTRQKTCDEGRGGHQEGNRAKGSVPSGGPRGRTSIEAARVGSSASTFRVHSRGSAASDRCVDSGERFSVRDAQSDAGSTVWRWSSPSNPTHAHFRPSKIRNVDQQPELRAQECIGGVWGFFNHCQGWRRWWVRVLQHSRDSRQWCQWGTTRSTLMAAFDRFSGCEAMMSARGFQSCVSIFWSGTKSERCKVRSSRCSCWGGVEPWTTVSCPTTSRRRC